MSDAGKRGSTGGDRSTAALYEARLSDPRERAAQPREALRGRAVRRAEKTSDITRFRGIATAAIAGAIVAAAAVLLTPPPGGLSSPGPLARPHAKAKLVDCASCHGEEGARAAQTPAERSDLSKACVRCHGPHPSTRPGHQQAFSTGQIGCYTCHTIHRGDQGVTFAPGQKPVRFAAGVEVDGPEVAFYPEGKVTIPIVTVKSCAGCHEVNSRRDPIARCLLAGQEALGPDRPIVCFDEHEVSLPDDGTSALGGGRGLAPPGRKRIDSPRDKPRREGGVCSGQHTFDRGIGWEAAREVAAVMPAVPKPDVTDRPWTWLFSGLTASALTFAFVRGGHALSAYRRRKQGALTPEAMIRPATRVRLPQIDPGTCLGCYACVDACPYDVLEIQRYVAVVARPEACCGLTLCEQKCPNGSLRITDGEPIGDRPRLRDSLESPDVPGLFLAGDITGLPLIKNAILQGAHAASAVAESLKGEKRGGGDLDLLIVGAGPAGISAALRAKELGLACEVVEQGSVAQSIQSFPRGKLVFDQPLELPVSGKLWLKESSKEELLSHWLRIVRQERLTIHQDTRMISLAREGSGFAVTTAPRDGGDPLVRRAKRVILAIGQRGSPRRLPFELKPEVEARVHYHLADARSFAGKKVILVGLGDVAMETAIALSRQPDTSVALIHRRSGFTRGKSRNIDEVKRLAALGRVTIHFDAEITDIDRDVVTVKTPARPLALRYDAVLVMIGSIPPGSQLAAAGVRTIAEEASLIADAKNKTASQPGEGDAPINIFQSPIG
jgi:thioredoxin reductase